MSPAVLPQIRGRGGGGQRVEHQLGALGVVPELCDDGA